MARDFDGSTQYIGPAIIPATVVTQNSGQMTIMCWVNRDTTGSNKQIVSFFNNASNHHFEFRGHTSTDYKLSINNSGTPAQVQIGGGGSGQWDFLCGRVNSSNQLKFWVNTTTGTGSHTKEIDNLDRVIIGANPPATPQLDGKVERVAAWNVALSDSTIESLRQRFDPYNVRRNSLICYYKLIGQRNPSVDYITGNTAAHVGSPPSFNGPRLKHARRQFFIPTVIAAGVGAGATPDSVQLTLTVPAVTATADVSSTTAPSPVQLTLTVPGATVVGDVSLVTSPAPTQLVLSVFALTVVGDVSISTTPDAVQLTLTVPVQDAVGGGTTATPNPVQITLTVPAATATYDASIVVTPAPVAMTLSIPSPAVVGDVSISAAPAPVQFTLSVPVQSAEGGQDTETTPASVSLIFAVPAPAVAGDISIAIAPDAVQLTFSVPAPIVSSEQVSGLVDIDIRGSPAVVISFTGDSGGSGTGGFQ